MAIGAVGSFLSRQAIPMMGWTGLDMAMGSTLGEAATGGVGAAIGTAAASKHIPRLKTPYLGRALSFLTSAAGGMAGYEAGRRVGNVFKRPKSIVPTQNLTNNNQVQQHGQASF